MILHGRAAASVVLGSRAAIKLAAVAASVVMAEVPRAWYDEILYKRFIL
jgi:hypothetical protein